MTKVLFFTPAWETATEYGRAWLRDVSRVAHQLGHQVYDLDREEATQENLLNALTEFQPELVIACSHGDPTRFSGQYGQIVFTACVNDEAMNGTQSFFLSCLMGQELAPSMDEKDALTVAAFVSEFIWLITPDYTSNELADPHAFPFYRAIFESCSTLLRGGSWRQFYDVFVRECNRGISEWFNSTDPSAGQIVAALEHDRDSLALFGETAISPVVGAIPVAIPVFLAIPVGLLGLSLIL